MGPLRAAPDGVRLRVRVQPRASRTEIAEVRGDALRVRLQAPPVDGAANAALIRLVADLVGVPRSAVSITAGAGAREKTLHIRGATLAAARAALSLPGKP